MTHIKSIKGCGEDTYSMLSGDKRKELYCNRQWHHKANTEGGERESVCGPKKKGPVCNFCLTTVRTLLPSVLWHSWLGIRKSIRPLKIEWWGVGVVVCLEQGADLHMAQLMPLPITVSCCSKIQIGFTFLVPAHLCSPRKRAVKWVCVCMCVGVVICLEQGANCLHMVQLMPLPSQNHTITSYLI